MHEGFWKIRLLAQNAPFPIKQVCRRVYGLLEFLGGCFIPLGAHFDGQPCFPHGIHGIFISAGCRIGRQCVIFQHVTIGSNTLPKSRGRGFPSIGHNCYIGAGAKIIGNVKIGDNVRIGANAVVHQDVPCNSVVTLGKQVVRTLDDPDNRFYTFRDGAWGFIEDGVWKPTEDVRVLEMLGEPY